MNSVFILTLAFVLLPATIFANTQAENDFLASLQSEQKTLVQLIEPDSVKRAQAIRHMETEVYSRHLEKYLSYYGSLNSYDILQEALNSEQILLLENLTREPYQQLLEELFNSKKIKGADFFRFFLFPEEFLNNPIKNEISVSESITWLSLFNDLRSSLPFGFSYKTQLRIDGDRPGGAYNADSNEIVFGDYPPNLSTVLGFIHEFGHSVFLVPSSQLDTLRNLAANEAYAEIWAGQILKYQFTSKILKNPSAIEKIEKYLRFRSLVSLRFHLFALHMDRSIHSTPILKADQYRALSARLSKRYLLFDDFPAILPAMPQMRIPGYLQAYLAIPFLKSVYETNIKRDVVKSLIGLGPIILADVTENRFDDILMKSVSLCLQGQTEKCF